MDDLGAPQEPLIDHFRCTQSPSHPLPLSAQRSPPSGNLLAATKHGHLLAGVGPSILVYSLRDLRAATPARPLATVALPAVRTVLALALLHDDAIVAVHVTRPDGTRAIVLASTPALAAGRLVVPARAPLAPPTAFAAHGGLLASVAPAGHLELVWLRRDAGAAFACTSVRRVNVSSAPVCVGIAPDETLLAVGTARGSIVLLGVDGRVRGTVVEVESGWRPFHVSFVAEREIFVSYVCGDLVSHVVWRLAGGDVLSVQAHSALGELCYASPGFEEEAQMEPVLTVHMVRSWNIAVVASSLSTDVEVIARGDGDEWENWKFGEGMAAVLPTDGDDNDTKPLGLTIDYTDTRPVDPMDPTEPKRNPMPRLIVLTSHGVLLPFALVDDTPDAKCEAVHDPAPLPMVPAAAPPEASSEGESDVAVKDDAKGDAKDDSKGKTKVEKRVEIESFPARMVATVGTKAEGLSLPPVPAKPSAVSAEGVEDTKGPVTSSAFGSLPSPKPFSERSGFAGSAGVMPSPPTTPFQRDSGKVTVSSLDARASKGHGTPGSSKSSFWDGRVGNGDGDKTDDTSVGKPLPPVFPKQKTAFSGSDKFLKNFSFAKAEDRKPAEISPAPSSKKDRDDLGAAGVSSSLKTLSMQSPAMDTVSLPHTTLKPSLVAATSAINAGGPGSLLESMLSEMTEEMNTSKSAERLTSKEITARDKDIMRTVQSIRSDLKLLLDATTRKFRRESSLRNEVSMTLKNILALSREYETLSLELNVREEEGFSRSLATEAKAMDERLAGKETEVLKAISSIEEKLNDGVRPNERSNGSRWSNSMQLTQQVYSSLSLQGIRIRKARSLLAALSERVEEQDRGGRRSDLGLSLARLEKLSLSDKAKREAVDDSDILSTPGSVALPRNSASKTLTDLDGFAGDGIHVLPNDVRVVLRRQAMRNGRSNICISLPPVPTRGTSSHVSPGDLEETQRAVEEMLPDPYPRSQDAKPLPSHVGRGRSISLSAGQQASATVSSRPSLSSTKPSTNAGLSGGSTFSRGQDDESGSSLPAVGVSRVAESGVFGRPSGSSEVKPERKHDQHRVFGSRSASFASSSPVAFPKSGVRRERGKAFLTGPGDPEETSRSKTSPFGVSGQSQFGASADSASHVSKTPTIISPTRQLPKSAGIPPRKSSVAFAALPPDDTGPVQSVTSVFGKESSSGTGKKVHGFSTTSSTPFTVREQRKQPAFAALPPDDSGQRKQPAFAALPPDDSEQRKPPAFAALPPDDSEHRKQPAFAALPPDDSSEASVARKGDTASTATLPLDNSHQTAKAGKPALTRKGPGFYASLPPSNDTPSHIAPEQKLKSSSPGTAPVLSGLPSTSERLSGHQDAKKPAKSGSFAYLPPQDNNSSPFGSFSFGTTASTAINPAVGVRDDTSSGSQDALRAPKSTSATDSLGFFGSSLNLGGPGSQSTTAADQRTSSSVGQGTQAAFASPFGATTGLTAPQSSSSIFGAVQADAAVGSLPRVEKAISTDSSGSDHSDEARPDNKSPFGSFGSTPASASQSGVFGGNQSMGMFGNVSMGNQGGSSAPLFGQQSPSPFGSSSTPSQPFGAGSMDTAQATGFGAMSSGQGGFSSSPFGNATSAPVTSFSSAAASFGATSSFGMSSQLGAAAAPVFGAGPPAATFGVSTFGSTANPLQSQPMQGGGFGSPASGFGMANATGSPAQFGATNSAFGGSPSGGSGFAALATPSGGLFGQNSSGAGFSGLANTPAFGNDTAPPAFTSAAFAQRRDV